MRWETVYIGFGSNLGDRQEFCERAITLMGLLPQTRFVAVSSFYETQPIDPEGILGSKWFYNGVVKIETLLTPVKLWEICRETEKALGREEDSRSGPRTIDLDLLFYGQHLIYQSTLRIPHPRLHLRRFVLEPFVELDPDWNHPTFNQTVKELLNQLDDKSQVRKLKVLPGSRFGNLPTCSRPNSS